MGRAWLLGGITGTMPCAEGNFWGDYLTHSLSEWVSLSYTQNNLAKIV